MPAQGPEAPETNGTSFDQIPPVETAQPSITPEEVSVAPQFEDMKWAEVPESVEGERKEPDEPMEQQESQGSDVCMEQKSVDQEIVTDQEPSQDPLKEAENEVSEVMNDNQAEEVNQEPQLKPLQDLPSVDV